VDAVPAVDDRQYFAFWPWRVNPWLRRRYRDACVSQAMACDAVLGGTAWVRARVADTMMPLIGEAPRAGSEHSSRAGGPPPRLRGKTATNLTFLQNQSLPPTGSDRRLGRSRTDDAWQVATVGGASVVQFRRERTCSKISPVARETGDRFCIEPGTVIAGTCAETRRRKEGDSRG